MAMAFAEEVAVFVETNLGTRIVVTVPLDITSADFKRKLEKTHASCLGEIRVHGLMVKRKSRFYHLAESVPIKYIFRGNQKPWFIHAEAIIVDRPQEPNISNSIDKSQIGYCFGSDKPPEGVVGLNHGVYKKTKKSLTKRTDSRKPASLDKRESLGPFTTEPETIIRSSLPAPRAAELNNSECSNSFTPKTPERGTGEFVSISETISKRLIVAANNIRMQGKSSMSCSLSSSIFRSKTRRKRSLDGKTLTSLAKFLVFEIPDTED